MDAEMISLICRNVSDASIALLDVEMPTAVMAVVWHALDNIVQLCAAQMMSEGVDL